MAGYSHDVELQIQTRHGKACTISQRLRHFLNAVVRGTEDRHRRMLQQPADAAHVVSMVMCQ